MLAGKAGDDGPGRFRNWELAISQRGRELAVVVAGSRFSSDDGGERGRVGLSRLHGGHGAEQRRLSQLHDGRGKCIARVCGDVVIHLS